MILIPLSSKSQESKQKITVGYTEYKPLIFKDKTGNLNGFEYDLLKEIAKDNNWSLEFKEMTFTEILNGKHNCDIYSAGISVTKDREDKYIFSHYTLNSGLKYVYFKNNSSIGIIWHYISNIVLSKALFIFIGFIIVFAHIIWLSERGEDAINDNYFPGIFESAYLVIISMSTVGYGDFTPKLWKGRIVVIFLVLTGISFFGWFVTEIINIPDYNRKMKLDEMKSIATIKDSTSYQYVKHLENVKVFDDIETVYTQFSKKGTYDCIVFDGPSIDNHFSNTDSVNISDYLTREKFAFICKNDIIRKQLNMQITSMYNSNDYKTLHDRWFK